jgi:hypothetical protein
MTRIVTTHYQSLKSRHFAYVAALHRHKHTTIDGRSYSTLFSNRPVLPLADGLPRFLAIKARSRGGKEVGNEATVIRRPFDRINDDSDGHHLEAATPAATAPMTPRMARPVTAALPFCCASVAACCAV